ncbi:hypothetical protein [Capnocytophaga sputigena]|jgi:cell wall surface anchor family protein|uniref:leucine-rich repeat domain-containing protein n=1 Tax=Capnocytophaga sputigena TaxID=1019 RepID=UPI0028D7C2DE|nr:hypothetical protein [Capnocytophaga sputigena]
MNKILLCFFLACLGFKTSILQAQLYGTDSYVTIYLDTNKVVDDYISFNLEFNNDSRVWIDLNNNQKYDEGELAYKFHSPEVNIEKENLQKEYRIYGELTILEIGNNSHINRIDLSHCSTLKELSINITALKELDISKLPNLVHCNLYSNGIRKLITNNPLLETLNIRSNELTELKLQKFPKLTELNCIDNKLKQLDLSNLPALKILRCNINQLSKLDVSKNKNLEELYCNYNQLSYLDLSHNSVLNRLECSKNSLKSIDIQQNGDLIDLDCESNYLTTLIFAKKNKITRLCIEHNSFKSEALTHLVAQLPIVTRSKEKKEPTHYDLVENRDKVKNVILLHEYTPPESRIRVSLLDDAYLKQDEQFVRFSKDDEKLLKQKGWKVIYKEKELE